MDTHQVERKGAQPADEEIKKHGDQLQKQVDEVSRPRQDEEDDAAKQEEK